MSALEQVRQNAPVSKMSTRTFIIALLATTLVVGGLITGVYRATVYNSKINAVVDRMLQGQKEDPQLPEMVASLVVGGEVCKVTWPREVEAIFTRFASRSPQYAQAYKKMWNDRYGKNALGATIGWAIGCPLMTQVAADMQRAVDAGEFDRLMQPQ